MKVNLSVVVITFNEEKNLARCLNSVRDIADDIVVVDSYSRDRTKEIAESLGARFIVHTFYSHIDQKNWALTQAKYPYVLSLDADECLSDELRTSILAVKEDWKYDGYFFNRLTNYCGKWIRHTTWYPSRKLRLWDARKGQWGGINPHDKYVLNGNSNNKKRLKGDLLHYSYYRKEEHLAQIEKFSTILANSYYKMGRKTSLAQRIIHASWRFLNDYLYRLGILDGKAGFTISRLNAKEVWLKYSKLRVKYKQNGTMS